MYLVAPDGIANKQISKYYCPTRNTDNLNMKLTICALIKTLLKVYLHLTQNMDLFFTTTGGRTARHQIS